MITIDLNKEKAAADKVTFYVDIFDEWPVVTIAVSDSPMGSSIKVLTSNLYPGSFDEWHQSISGRLRDFLKDADVITTAGDEDDETLNLDKLEAI